MRLAALLRGVNVGGNRKLPMAELARFVEALGYRRVRTLLASGNVVFDADEPPAAVEARLQREAADGLGLATEWLVRSHRELAAVVAADPMPDAAADRPSGYLVHFHRDVLTPEIVAAIHHDGPERWVAIGRELYVDYAGRLSDSRLPQALARAGSPRAGTGRNWNTVVKLVELTG